MLFLVGTALVLLCTLVVAGVYFKFFDQFPSEWEWFFGILSIVGFIVGAVVFPQLVWGKPRLAWNFYAESREGQCHLGIMFKNPQITQRFLRTLGVYRQAIQSLVVQFRIAEAGSGVILIPNHQAIIYSDEDEGNKGRKRVALPSTFSVGASVLVLTWDYANAQAIVPPDGLRPAHTLGVGQYRADVIALVDGEPVRQQRQFVVGAKPEELVWVPSVVTKR